MAAQHSAAAPAGIIAPDGSWAAQGPGDGHPALAIADIDNRPESINIAVAKARPWRRLARAGVYDAPLVTDDRSDDPAPSSAGRSYPGRGGPHPSRGGPG